MTEDIFLRDKDKDFHASDPEDILTSLVDGDGICKYFFRMQFEDKTEEKLLEQATTEDDFNCKLSEVQTALFDYLKWFDVGPDLLLQDKDKALPTMKWNKSKNDKEATRYIVKLAMLLSHLRCVAQTWETPDTQGSDYAYSVSQPEDPSRAVTVLNNLARGHALLTGRNYITIEDIPIIVKTVLSTAQIERVSLFDLLMANHGKLTATWILESLNISRPTALRTMAELKAIGLVDAEDIKEEGQNYISKQIKLKPEFEWLLKEDFEKLREDFTPTDNRQYLKRENQSDREEKSHYKEKSPLTTNNYSLVRDDGNGHGEKEDIFWQIYEEEEKKEQQDPANYMQVDKNTISGKRLQQRLVSSNKFYVGDAFQMIKNMVEAGKLEVVSYDTYRRSTNNHDNSNTVKD